MMMMMTTQYLLDVSFLTVGVIIIKHDDDATRTTVFAACSRAQEAHSITL
jgi:hypothetical protein